MERIIDRTEMSPSILRIRMELGKERWVLVKVSESWSEKKKKKKKFWNDWTECWKN